MKRHPFEVVRAGEIIGTDSDTPVPMSADGVVVFVRERKNGGEEAFIYGVEEQPMRM